MFNLKFSLCNWKFKTSRFNEVHQQILFIYTNLNNFVFTKLSIYNNDFDANRVLIVLNIIQYSYNNIVSITNEFNYFDNDVLCSTLTWNIA